MNKEVVNILKKKVLLILFIFLALGLAIYLLVINEGAPITQVIEKNSRQKELKEAVATSEKALQQILADNESKQKAAKNATIKAFYYAENDDFSPMLENITTFIKQDGLRMKSIKIDHAPTDNLTQNGAGTYTANKVDFELVGYYPQFVTLLNDISNYQYFVSVHELDIKPYEYNKKILISNFSVILYSKRQ